MDAGHKLSERDICTKFIVPALQAAGWDIQRQVREEVSFYYQAQAEIFSARDVPAAKVLDATVEWMHELAGAEFRVALVGARRGIRSSLSPGRQRIN